jgi:hypothetical protein
MHRRTIVLEIALSKQFWRKAFFHDHFNGGVSLIAMRSHVQNEYPDKQIRRAGDNKEEYMICSKV